MQIRCPRCGSSNVAILENCGFCRSNTTCFEPFCSFCMFLLCGLFSPRRACLNVYCQCRRCGCRFKI